MVLVTGTTGNNIINGAGSDDLAGELGADTITGGGDSTKPDGFSSRGWHNYRLRGRI